MCPNFVDLNIMLLKDLLRPVCVVHCQVFIIMHLCNALHVIFLINNSFDHAVLYFIERYFVLTFLRTKYVL